MSIRIGILGTRGIPNHYGGFERLAEQLSPALAEMGHEVFVYNSHNHVYQEDKWGDVNIIHCYDPEFMLGCSGQFIYDLNCILDARKRAFDVILILGYTSSSVWNRFLPASAAIIYNMDGMEWKRAKYSKMTRKFLRYAERLAVAPGNFYITDSPAIQTYYEDTYALESEYIAYGAAVFSDEKEEILSRYGLTKNGYYLLMARMEPENNIEMILDGFRMSMTGSKFLVVGNIENKYGKRIMQKFGSDPRICFAGAVFDEETMHSLRIFSRLYFHGHSTGGTNPSLLEAMASNAFIAAHDNIFNKMVLQEDAFYFSDAIAISKIINETEVVSPDSRMIGNNAAKIRARYNWKYIFTSYERFMLRCLYMHAHGKNVPDKRYSV
jgi:glycosyltransferase involved in cell wall biosynthesis